MGNCLVTGANRIFMKAVTEIAAAEPRVSLALQTPQHALSGNSIGIEHRMGVVEGSDRIGGGDAAVTAVSSAVTAMPGVTGVRPAGRTGESTLLSVTYRGEAVDAHGCPRPKAAVKCAMSCQNHCTHRRSCSTCWSACGWLPVKKTPARMPSGS